MASSNVKPETVSPPSSEEKKDESKKNAPMSSVGEVMSFVWACSFGTRLLFLIGVFGGIGNGAVYPILAYLFSTSFSKISSADDGLAQIREVAYTFMVVGAFALAMASLQTGCFEVVAYRASRSFRLQWFKALLRQDAAFFDVHDVSGIAATVGPNSRKYHRGIGRKFGEGIQFSTTCIGGIGYAFYSSWRVAFVVIAVLPLVSVAAYFTVQLNQTKGTRSAKAYAKAGSVAYSTVSSIKTVLSLNAIPEMVRQYAEATLEAYSESIKILWKQGFFNGSMLGSFILLYCVLTLFGTFLLYRDVEDTGCDPSNGVSSNETCQNSGPDVFGAMLGVAFAAQGLSQVGTFFETFTASRVACYQATLAINRKIGSPEQEIYEEDDELVGGDVEEGAAGKAKAIVPEYTIDSSSSAGLKPEKISGAVSFKNVSFSYPTRPYNPILSSFDLEIPAGKTVAIVGPSGGGKSTTVSLIERFYDPTSGSVELDGVNLKDINVTHLRRQIGYVGQEPTLFATSIAGNIRYGNPDATQEQVEAAARMANAHDFVSSFPDGYETQVGDKGAQLSGGQKQRIAIARVLVANPRILLLDEATSALDSESELVVQDALDNVVAEHKRTTIVIAHRLSTIRNADVIAVVVGGKVVEMGSHDELMVAETGHYRLLVDKQEGRTSSTIASRENSEADLRGLDSSNHSSVSEISSKRASVAPGSTHFEFRGVTFAYPTRPSKPVLDGFNLRVRAGETIALVGPSGGGKSTTVSLIERFYDPTSGSVAFNDVDVKLLNVKWYRDQIGYVGQEPTLFNTSIANNIAYGAPGASQEDIEEAARMANAHDFISAFPDGYDTNVGERGAQLSGGQKQRVAIARALVKKPQVLLLDEATSALDTESESIVQEALDRLMSSKDHTTIVIAHRLSTIRNVDRIAYIADGKVKEFGSHDELMEKRKGLYKRLVESQRRGSSIEEVLKKLKKRKVVNEEEEEGAEEVDYEAEIEEKEKKAFSMERARKMAAPDVSYMFVGAVGSVLAGGVFPCWGIMFAETINLLFRRVLPCDSEEDALLLGFATCDEYWDFEAEDMRETSFQLAGYWVIVAVGCVVGNMLVFWGFGKASERLNKRVRDAAFSSLVRQEVAYFDKRSVGSITSQLEEDAARIHTFSGEPIRSFLVAFSSVVTGVIVSFVFMWPFALLSLATIPVMGFATEVEMRTFLGEDEGKSAQDELNSPGGIIVETLLNIRTVAALTLEKARFQDYERALQHENNNYVFNGFKNGFTAGMSMFIQQWVNALQLWWGGWLLFNYPEEFTFNEFLISMFSLLFSLFGLGAAFQGMSDRKETEKSAGRVFYLLDRESEIDPLNEGGKKLDSDPLSEGFKNLDTESTSEGKNIDSDSSSEAGGVEIWT